MTKPSALIIGCGSIGERHLRCFQRTGRVAATAVDTSAAILQRMRETYGVATHHDWRAELSSGRHQLAVICTPAQLHLPMATEALRHGLHVLIEKPLSHSLAGVDELLAARAHSGTQAAVGYVFHAVPVLRAARDFLAPEPFGPILQAVLTAGQAFHRLRPAYASTYYRDRASGGGAIQDALTHSVNWVESILGPTESVLCDCAHLALPDVAVEDTVHISARHARAHVSYALNQFQAPNETTFQFNSAQGSVRVELHTQRWGTFTPGAADWDWRPPVAVERDQNFIAQANAFLDAIEGRAAPLCTVESALQTLRFNLAALASADSGRRVACASLT